MKITKANAREWVSTLCNPKATPEEKEAAKTRLLQLINLLLAD